MFRLPGVRLVKRPIARTERKHPPMPDSSTPLDFPLLSRKALQVDFSGGSLSSDGGLLLLAQLDRQTGLTERVARCIEDPRLVERVAHPLLDLVRHRVYQI